MTAAFSWPLQQGLYAALSADADIANAVHGRIVDGFIEAGAAPPKGPSILIGEEQVRPWGSATENGAEHRITVTLMAPEGGFAALKQLAARVSETVLAGPPLAQGRIVLATFLAARARRHRSRGIREIDLQFRVVVEDDAPSP
jgi:hypothetical protein